jgi:PPOX class probable F420-dependent enzyme
VSTIPDSHRDLIEGPHLASLSTVGPDGAPQVTALSYLWEGDTIATSVTTSRQKCKNVRSHPKATLFIIDPANPFRTLEVRADATIEDDPGLALMDRIVRHYGHDPENLPADRDNRVVLRLTPTRVVGNG